MKRRDKFNVACSFPSYLFYLMSQISLKMKFGATLLESNGYSIINSSLSWCRQRGLSAIYPANKLQWPTEGWIQSGFWPKCNKVHGVLCVPEAQLLGNVPTHSEIRWGSVFVLSCLTQSRAHSTQYKDTWLLPTYTFSLHIPTNI